MCSTYYSLLGQSVHIKSLFSSHRNGRFINNIFVPEGAEITLPEYTVQSQLTQENR
jgi:hypothetical protein